MAEAGLYCIRCGKEPAVADCIFDGCSSCRSEGVTANFTTKGKTQPSPGKQLHCPGQPGIWKYRGFYSIPGETPAVSLDEGNTPLILLEKLGKELGVPKLYIKDESRNPTWSHKDRLCSVGVTKAKAIGARVITVSSTGNHGASTAAYAARAGLPCVAFTTTTVPQTMKTLMQSYGALLVATATPRDRWVLMKRCVKDFGWYPLSGYVYPPIGSNPYAIDGYKSIAFEIWEQLGTLPDKVLIPTAYGDVLIGVWKGFLDLQQIFGLQKVSQLVAVEPFGALTRTLASGSALPIEVPGGRSVSFSVATTRGTVQGLAAIRDSNGYACEVHDDRTLAMQRCLAGKEGLFAEASSAMAVAGVAELLSQGKMNSAETVVVLLTSTGLKDPGTAAEYLPPTPLVQPNLADLRRVLAESYNFRMEG